MKYCIFLAILLFPLLPLAAQARDPLYLGYNNGSNYAIIFSDNERSTYAQGFINGITLRKVFENQDNYDAFMRCTQKLTAGQIGQIIKEYIMNNPAKEKQALNFVSIEALNTVCKIQFKK